MVISPLPLEASALRVREAVVPASPRLVTALPATIGTDKSQLGISKIDQTMPPWVVACVHVVVPVEGDAPTPHQTERSESGEAMVPNWTVAMDVQVSPVWPGVKV